MAGLAEPQSASWYSLTKEWTLLERGTRGIPWYQSRTQTQPEAGTRERRKGETGQEKSTQTLDGRQDTHAVILPSVH